MLELDAPAPAGVGLQGRFIRWPLVDQLVRAYRRPEHPMAAAIIEDACNNMQPVERLAALYASGADLTALAELLTITTGRTPDHDRHAN